MNGIEAPTENLHSNLARYLRGGPIKNVRLVAWDGARVTFTRRARHESDGARPGLQQMTLPVADFLRAAAACTRTPDAGRAVVWAVPSQPRGGPGCPSCGAWPAADGGASRAGLADGVCAAVLTRHSHGERGNCLAHGNALR